MGNILVFDSLTTTDAHIFGGINFLHDLNTGEEFSIGNTAAASVSFVTDAQLPLYTKDPVNGTFVWQQDDSPRGAIITDTQSYLAMGDDVLGWGTSSNKGRYFITEVTREKGKYTVTAYDAMILLETSISALSLTYPLTVSAAASAIATYIDCTILGDIHNGTMAAQDGTIDETTTIRQLLAWVAEASGASVKIDGSDHLCFMYYAATGPTVTPSEIKEAGLEIADYTCAPIDNVTICDMAGMTSATAGSGTNSLFIVGNPFLYDATNTEAAVILSLVEDFEYAPLTCEMFDENGLEVGVTAVFGTIPTLVMHLESSEDGVVASSVGSDSRAEFNKTVEMVANEALTTAQEAQQTADELNLHFWYTASGAEAGAHIAEVDKETFESNPSGGNLLARSNGIAVRNGLTELAAFGAEVRVGQASTRHVEIKDGGFQVYTDASTVMAHIGYGTGNTETGTATSPYFTFGKRIGSTVGSYSVAEGYDTTATGYCSHAEGKESVASGSCSHAEGQDSTASGHCSHAEGLKTEATGESSHAEGHAIEGGRVIASGLGAHAEGYASGSFKIEASDVGAHAEGYSAYHDTIASAEASHAEGAGTTASGFASHAEGNRTVASGNDSHAEGMSTQAVGAYSHAGGDSTIANGEAQTAIGKYNVPDSTSLLIVGNGSPFGQSNALKVDSDGNVRAKGDLYVGCNADGSGGTKLVNVGAVNLVVNHPYQAITTGWEYVGASFTVPSGHIYLVMLTAGWTTGKPIGLGINSSSSLGSVGVPDYGFVENSSYAGRTPLLFLSQGTYFLFCKRATVPTGNNNHSAYAIDVTI